MLNYCQYQLILAEVTEAPVPEISSKTLAAQERQADGRRQEREKKQAMFDEEQRRQWAAEDAEDAEEGEVSPSAIGSSGREKWIGRTPKLRIVSTVSVAKYTC